MIFNFVFRVSNINSLMIKRYTENGRCCEEAIRWVARAAQLPAESSVVVSRSASGAAARPRSGRRSLDLNGWRSRSCSCVRRVAEDSVGRDFEVLQLVQPQAKRKEPRRQVVPSVNDAVRKRAGQVRGRTHGEGAGELRRVPPRKLQLRRAGAPVWTRERRWDQRGEACRRGPALELEQVRERANRSAVRERVQARQRRGRRAEGVRRMSLPDA